MPKDETGLSWSGSPKPVRSGGFVGSISVNADARGALAVDPDAVAKPKVGKRSGSVLEGPAVDVSVMTEKPDTRERPRGRFKMPLG